MSVLCFNFKPSLFLRTFFRADFLVSRMSTWSPDERGVPIRTPTWPTAWRQWGIVGISAGPPWSDCGPASVSSAGTLSGFWPRCCRPAGSAPAAAGARRPEDGREVVTGYLYKKIKSFLLNVSSYQNLKSITELILIFLQTFMMTGCSKLYMEFDFLCRNFLNSKRKTGKIRQFYTNANKSRLIFD